MKFNEKKPAASPRTNKISIFLSRKILPIFLALFLLFSGLAGCRASDPPTALSLLLAMTAAEENLPAGDLYVLPGAASLERVPPESTPSDRLYIAAPDLLASAFGNSEISLIDQEIWQLSSERVDDGALRLSCANSSGEWMVFHCISRTDTEALACLLLARLEVLRRADPDENKESRGGVYIVGHYVLLLRSQNEQEQLSIAKKIIY